MKVYMLTYDNGEGYEMNHREQIAIFDTFDKAAKHALSVGFKPLNDKTNVFIREKAYKEYIYIDEFEMNKIYDKYGFLDI